MATDREKLVAFAKALSIEKADFLPDQKIDFIIKLGEEITRRGFILADYFNKTGGDWSEIEEGDNKFIELETL